MTLEHAETLPAIFDGLSPFARAYTKAAHAAIINEQEDISCQIVLGETHIPVSLYSKKEGSQHMREVDFRALQEKWKDNPEGLENILRSMHVTIQSLDAGLGESVRRTSHKKRIAESFPGITDSSVIGSKATDIFMFPQAAPASIMDLHLTLDLWRTRRVGHVALCPIVNDASKPFVEAQYLKPTYQYLYMTYEDAMVRNGHTELGEYVMQEALPMVDPQTNQLLKRRAPGGHGQAAAQILYDIKDSYSEEQSPCHKVRIVKNGDGLVPGYTEEILAASTEAGVTMVVAEATKSDSKGGKIMFQMLPDGRLVPTIVEVGQVNKNDRHLFYQFGQDDATLPSPLAERHYPCTQSFNTNTALFNEGLLGIFLHVLEKAKGTQYIQEFILPDFFHGDGESAWKLEGAMGSLILRMNKLIEIDDEIKALWNRIGEGKPFVQFVFVDAANRDEVFQPVKFPIDVAEKKSDLFQFDPKQRRFVRTVPGHFISWQGLLTEKGSFYTDVENMRLALGENALISSLKSLTVEGICPVIFPDALHGGSETIICNYYLPNGEEYLDLTQSHWADVIGRDSDGRLDLRNKVITIDSAGSVQVVIK